VQDPPGDYDWIAQKVQFLARVSVAGERAELPGQHVATADAVIWRSDGEVAVNLAPEAVEIAYLDALRADGWAVFPRRDADDWLKAATR
jgi:hypothetical protein